MSKQFHSIRATVLGCLVVLLIAWRVVAAGGVFLQEARSLGRVGDALTWSQEERFSSALSALEVRTDFEAGELSILRAALAQWVNAEDQVLVVSSPKSPRRLAATRLGVLAFPAQFSELDGLPLDGPPDPSAADKHLFILDFVPSPKERLEAWFQLRAEGSSFRLWQGLEESQ